MHANIIIAISNQQKFPPVYRPSKKSTNIRGKSNGTCYLHNLSLLQSKRQLAMVILFLGMNISADFVKIEN